MLNFNNILIFSNKPQKLVDFYAKVFQRQPDWTGGDFAGFKVGDGFITFGPHDMVTGMNENPERMMFNLETDDVESEFGRIVDLGGVVVAEPYHPGEDEQGTIATLADPDGNYFQLVTPMMP